MLLSCIISAPGHSNNIACNQTSPYHPSLLQTTAVNPEPELTQTKVPYFEPGYTAPTEGMSTRHILSLLPIEVSD